MRTWFPIAASILVVSALPALAGCTIGGMAIGGIADSGRYERIEPPGDASSTLESGDRVTVRTDAGMFDARFAGWISPGSTDARLLLEIPDESVFLAHARRDTILVSDLVSLDRKKGPLAAPILGGVGLAIDIAFVSWILNSLADADL